MYRLRLSREATKELDRLQGHIWNRMRDALLGLRDDPRPPGCAKLRDRTGYRIRVGDYRILYDVDDERAEVTVLSVQHRRDAYR